MESEIRKKEIFTKHNGEICGYEKEKKIRWKNPESDIEKYDK